MSPNDDFRRELNNVFDEVSGAPSPALRDRVRSAVIEAPEARGPYMIAAVAAVVLTALIIGVLYLANPLRQSPIGSVGPGKPTPSPSAAPSTQPTPTPSQSTLPPFGCSANSLAPSMPPTQQPIAYVNDLKTGAHPGYERLTITFSNGLPHDGIQLKLGDVRPRVERAVVAHLVRARRRWIVQAVAAVPVVSMPGGV